MWPATPIDFYFLFVILLIRMMSWFPYRPVRVAMATALANLSYHLSLSKLHSMKRAVTVAFGEDLNDRELAHILKGSQLSFWLEILGAKPNRIDIQATREAQVIGWEHLERALAAGKGVILWESNGFGRRFWSKQILNRKGVRVHQIRGPNHLGSFKVHNATATWVRRCVIRPFFDDAESPYIQDMTCLPSNGSMSYGRLLLQRLHENAVICVAADGEIGAKHLPVPFLGSRYLFSTGMVSLARMSGAALLPIFCLETDDHKACLIIEEPMDVSEDYDRERQNEQIVSQYAKLLEHYIRREPAAYRNWHKEKPRQNV